MVVYKVFYKNYELKKGEFVGLLVERRKDLRGKTQLESGLRWARLTFGSMVRDSRAIFVMPSELMPGSDAKRLMEKGVFTRVELLGMTKPIDRKIKKRRAEDFRRYDTSIWVASDSTKAGVISAAGHQRS